MVQIDKDKNTLGLILPLNTVPEALNDQRLVMIKFLFCQLIKYNFIKKMFMVKNQYTMVVYFMMEIHNQINHTLCDIRQIIYFGSILTLKKWGKSGEKTR